jgi:hypothetical protein
MPLGDANRGSFLALQSAVSNLEEPAAPTPPSGGFFLFSLSWPAASPPDDAPGTIQVRAASARTRVLF